MRLANSEVVVQPRVTWMLHRPHPLETDKGLCMKADSTALITEFLDLLELSPSLNMSSRFLLC